VCHAYFRHVCCSYAELLSCDVSAVIFACSFRFDVELEVRARSRADAVRVPATRVVVMVILMDPPLMGALI